MAGFTIGADRVDVRAWVNFDGTGTLSVRDSYNVSSVSDEGAGLYQVNFTSSMSNSSYCVAGLSSGHSADVSLSRDIYLRGYSALATSDVEVQILRDYDAVVEDGKLVTVVVLGN